MNFNEYEYQMYHSKDWFEAEKIALEFFNCDPTHTKINTTLYRRVIEGSLNAVQKKDYKNLTCSECKTKKYKFDE